MSNTIDERVVSMKFDNKQFEDNVSTSMSTLDKLKERLSRLPEAVSGLANIGAGVKNVGLDTLGASVDTIANKFKFMGMLGVQALNDITRKIVSTGEQMIKSLTVDPINDGFQEYSLKMGSVQTIMAGTGESLDTVMKKLNELNAYSDKTIYSFADMTSNIGKFTNAGVKLDDAVGAIQGVANVAAVSGADAARASSAMYNFAQALSAGYVKLIDWKSIEVANMATVEFKEQLMQSAVAMGMLKDNADGTYTVITKNAAGSTMKEAISATKNFNESLAYQWMTTDVLTETLNQYSTDLSEMTDSEKEAYEERLRGLGYSEEQIKKIEEISEKAFAAATEVKTFSQLMDTLKEGVGSGWAETFELIFGNFDEVKALWSSINDILGGILQKQADARNALIKGWKNIGGRDSLIKSFWNVFDSIVEVADAVKESFNDIFPKATSERLMAITKSIENFTAKVKGSLKDLEGFKAALRGIFSVIDITRKLVKILIKTIAPIGDKYLSPIAEKVKNFTIGIADMLQSLNKSISSADSLGSALKKIFSKFGDYLAETSKVGAAVKAFGETIHRFGMNADLAFERSGGGIEGWSRRIFLGINGAISAIIKFIEVLTGADLSKFESKITKSIQKISNVVSSGLGNIADFLSVSYLEGGGGLAGVLEVIFDLLVELVRKSNEFIESITGWDLSEFTNKFVGKLQEIRNNVVGFVLDVQNTDGIFGKIQAHINKIAEGIGGVFGKALGSIDWSGLEKGTSVFYQILIGIFGIISTLTASIGKGLGNIFSAFSEGSFDGLIDLVNSGIIAAFVLQLTNFFHSASDLMSSEGGLTAAIKSIGDTITDTFTALQDQLKANALLEIAAAIGILAIALILIAGIDSDKLTGALLAITAMFYELCTALQSIVSTSSGLGSGGLGKLTTALIMISVAVLLLAAALKKVSDIDPESLAYGLASITALVVELVGVANMLPEGSKGFIKTSVALVLFSIAVSNISKALAKLSDLNPDGLAQAGIAIAGVMGALTTIAEVLNGNALNTSTGASLLLMSAGVLLIASAIGKLANLDTNAMGLGLAAVEAVMFSMMLFARLANGTTGVDKAAKGMLAMAAAIYIIAKAMETVSSLSGEQVVLVMLSLSYAMAALIALTNYVDPSKLGKLSLGMIGFAAAMMIMALAIKTMGSMDILDMCKGILGLTVLLGVLIGATKLLEGSNGISGAASMIVLALAINILATAMKTLGSMSLAEIGKGILAIVAAIAVLGIAAALLTPVAPVMLLIAGALALLGVSIFTIGAGVSLLAAGLGLLAVNGVAGLAALETALLMLIGLVPKLIVSIVDGFIQSITVIAKAVPQMIVLFGAILEALCGAIMEYSPLIIETLVKLLDDFLRTVADHTPSIVQSLVELGLGIISGFLEGLAQGLPDIVAAGTDLIVNFLYAITDSKLRIIDAAFETIITFVNGLADSIEEHTPELKEAIGNLFTAMKEAAIEMFSGPSAISDIWEAASNFVGGLVKGIKEGISKVKDAAGELANGALDKIKGIFKVHSPSKVMEEIGGYLDEGLANGIKDSSGEVSKAIDIPCEAIMYTAYDASEESKGFFSSLFDVFNEDSTPTITPVVDMTNVDEAKKDMDSMFGSNSYTASAAASTSGSYSSAASSQQVVNDQLSSYKAMFENYLSKMQEAISNIPGTDVDVQLNADARKIFNMTVQANRDYQRRTGKSAYAQ